MMNNMEADLIQIEAYMIVIAIIVIDILIRLALILYVPRNRKPTAAIAWLLAIFLLPGLLGFLLFIIIGGTKVSRLRRDRQDAIDSLIAQSIGKRRSPDYPERISSFVSLSKYLGKFPASDGNHVTLHANYQETIDRIVYDVRKAEKYIYIESYILALDTTTEPLFEALEAATKRGVKIYLLFDAIGSRKFKNWKLMRQRLTNAGIPWRKMLPISLIPRHYSRPDLRNHRKLIAIDNQIAYIGSLNLIHPRYERKDDIIYEELVARMEGPIATHTAAIIAGDWYSETGQHINEFQQLPVSPKKGKSLLHILPSGSAYKGENNIKVFLELIYDARKSIVITNPYLVPSEPLLTALITAAQRGVKVTVINSEAIDQWMVGHAQRSYYQEFLDAGVTIYLHNAPELLHSKHITIDDDIAVIGSSNMDIRSFELNMECSLIAYDKHIVTQLKKLHRVNISHSTQLTKQAWKERSLWNSFLDSVSRLTSSLQ